MVTRQDLFDMAEGRAAGGATEGEHDGGAEQDRHAPQNGRRRHQAVAAVGRVDRVCSPTRHDRANGIASTLGPWPPIGGPSASLRQHRAGLDHHTDAAVLSPAGIRPSRGSGGL